MGRAGQHRSAPGVGSAFELDELVTPNGEDQDATAGLICGTLLGFRTRNPGLALFRLRGIYDLEISESGLDLLSSARN